MLRPMPPPTPALRRLPNPTLTPTPIMPWMPMNVAGSSPIMLFVWASLM